MLAEVDRTLVAAVARGLPLVARPYAALGAELGIEEGEVLERLRCLLSTGVIKRLGVVVRHHELGYRANAMVVWDVPDERVAEAGARLGALDCVTLCYRRPRRPPVWPYNFFCMIHGRDRSVVLAQVEEATAVASLQGLPRAVLFSRRRFKQRGARYDAPSLPC